MTISDNFPKRFNPNEIEPTWVDRWSKSSSSRAEIGAGEPFTIVIPPPNVTGALHMGHALNATLQDILIRWRRMTGRAALWLPGTDHAGIATQNVVERRLAEKGVRREQLGRKKFLEEVWRWKEEYGGRITEQLTRLGASCDWSRERFTMDQGLSKAVREAFVSLYRKGLIYRGRYMINWCPRCRTALSNEEARPQEADGHLWVIRYPFRDGDGHVSVATTRPETMLGDTAVAVNPEDSDNRELAGKWLVLPLVGREIPIVADSFVDPEFGTGLVKVTPAHDPNDFEIGQRHGLEQVEVIGPDGTMTEAAPEAYRGLDRFECRRRVVEDLEARGLLVEVKDHRHAVGRCHRCGTVIEPLASDQWFVKMKPLAEPALKAVETGEIKFYPERWEDVYREWMVNIRDWCISRQIWWGHRIPIWYCDDCDQVVVPDGQDDPKTCDKCGSGKLTQDPDVLDTWFSSWLWPFSTLGWPDKTEDMDYFYPTDVLVTGVDILFFWVARMIMAGLEFVGPVPFRQVFFNGMVKDEIGRIMSKSLGNGIDPLEMIDKYGADALRFSLAALTTQGQDINLAENRLEMGRNFAQKVWSAARLLVLNMDGAVERDISLPAELNELSDRWIVSRYQAAVRNVSRALEKFHFSEAALAIYNFLWHEYCDWYLELAKPRLRKPGVSRATCLDVSRYVLDGSLGLLHPFMPFITEEIAALLPGGDGMLIGRRWPDYDDSERDRDAEESITRLQEFVTSIRNLRHEFNVPPAKPVDLIFKLAGRRDIDLIRDCAGYLRLLAGAAEMETGPDMVRPDGSVARIGEGYEIYLILAGLIDLEAEKERLQRELAKADSEQKNLGARLQNKEFLSKAPQIVIEKEKERLNKVRERIEKLSDTLTSLT